jgi:hypothetical protein
MNAYSKPADLDSVQNEEERHDWIHFLKQALQYQLEMLSELQSDWGLNSHDYEWVHWLFERLARVIPEMHEDEHPERFWQPILELGIAGHQLIKMFFNLWFIENLGKQVTAGRFVDEWRRIFDFATQSARWSSDRVKSNYLEDIWCSLMGISGTLVLCWTKNRKPLIDQMQDKYEAWAIRHLERPLSAENFCDFLKQPATEGLRIDALVWFDNAAQRIGDPYLSDSEVEQRLVSFLDFCWTKHPREIGMNTNAFDGLKRLLNMLANRQNATAFEILRRIASR